MKLIPENQLSVLGNGTTVRLCRVDPCGTLYARKGTSGLVTFTWRFTFNGQNDAEVIGLWDREADPRRVQKTPKGWTVAAATRQAEEWAREHENLLAEGGFRSVQTRLAIELAEADVTQARLTLGHLMSDYCALLEARGQAGSAADVYYATRRHIELVFNHIWRKPAIEVTPGDIIQIMKLAATKLHPKTVGKLRGYLQTAYQRAIDSRSRSDIPERFKLYNITHNVVKEIANPEPAKGETAKPIKALSQGQLRWYWQQLLKVDGLKGTTLRLQLLSGGQRPAQLVRLKRANIAEDYFTIFDPKGRSATARPHAIPITPTIAKTLAEFDQFGTHPMSATGGKRPLVQQTLTNWAADVVGDAIPGFQLKLVRSGVETILSKWKVDKEHRGRLQSHGVAGVQDKHYNAYDFLGPKREALLILEAILNGELEEPPTNPILEALELRRKLAQQEKDSLKTA